MIANNNFKINKKRINANTIEYLCFEGGGGKGIIYLGAVKALEEKLKVKRLIDITSDLDSPKRKIKGISGASAGAITSFMLALGLSAEEIDEEMKTIIPDKGRSTNRYYLMSHKGKKLHQISGVTAPESFLGLPTPFYRTIERNRRVYHYPTTRSYETETIIASLLEKLFISPDGIVENGLVDDPLLQRLFYRTEDQTKNSKNAGIFIHNLLYHRGIFSGHEIRFFFQSLVQKYLIDKYEEQFKSQYGYTFPKPENLTFYDFYKFTGVDLVISGTNISQQRPLFFSAYHTPDFPVTEAVAISMNIPIVFKPIYIDYDVDKNRDKKYNLFYKGLWGDGGMLNNFPIHAFDDLQTKKMEFKGKTINRKIAATTYNSDKKFNMKTLGFMLGDDVSNLDPTPKERKEEFPLINPGFSAIGTYLNDIFRSFMYSGSMGRIRNINEESYTIELNSEDVDILDFSHPDIDKLRADFLVGKLMDYRYSQAVQMKLILDKFRAKYKNKKRAIEDAYDLVKSIIS